MKLISRKHMHMNKMLPFLNKALDLLQICRKTGATITRCDLSATILFKFVDSCLIAFEFAQQRNINIKNRGDKSHRVIVA